VDSFEQRNELFFIARLGEDAIIPLGDKYFSKELSFCADKTVQVSAEQFPKKRYPPLPFGHYRF
jgi:hypothetical protein